MKSKIKIGLVLLLGLFLFPIGYMNNAQAAESKEVLINQINTVENETLTFNATAGGRLEVVVPLAYVSQNENWKLWVSEHNEVEFNSYDVMEDKTVFKGYLAPGVYKLMFTGGKAVCQINFVTDSIGDEIEENDSFETANLLQVNMDKNGQLRYGYEEDYFKLILAQNGMLQFDVIGEESREYKCEVYQEDNNGNLELIDEIYDGIGEEKTKRFFAQIGTYYIKMRPYYLSSSFDINYKVKANFIPIENSAHEIETNDVYTMATDIEVNLDYSGNLEDRKDIDWYHIKLSESQLGQVLLKTTHQKTDSIYDVTFYKKENNKLKEIGNFQSKTNNVLHNTEKIYLEDGDYYIKIKNYSFIESLELSEEDYQIQVSTQKILLPQPQITVQQETFPNITITSSEFGEFESGMEVYEKVGNGDWKLSQISYENECSTAVSKLGEKCSYRVRTYYKDEESGVTVYSDYSNEESITLPKLKQPTLSVKRSNFSEVTLSFSNIDSRAESIIIYQKVGNSNWKQVKTVSSKVKSSKIAIKTLGKKYSYQIKSEADFFYSNASKVKSITISSKLEKPTFTVTKKKYYGTLAFYIKPTKYNYAQGVEIWSSDAKGYWDYKSKLNLSKSKGTYFYNLEKGRSYYIKMRSYRKVNGKIIYSPWTAVKKVVR